MTDEYLQALLDTGRDAWEAGESMPKRPTDDAAIFAPTTLYWFGYMSARARDFFRRRDMALYPDTVEPRP